MKEKAMSETGIGALNADLHCHSTMSDGWLEPAAVVRRAKAHGVDLLALTDHDELGGLAEAAAEAARLELDFVPGVEASVSFAGETIHVVGLGFDPHDRRLNEGLAQVRSGREERAERIAAELARVGLKGTLEGARQFARNPVLISRAHFARHLVASGVMPNVKTVFDHYLAKGKPGYVEHEWAALEEAVGWIRGAGGIAVLAHPARYRISTAELETLLDHFSACGGEGIEVVTGAHSEDEIRRFAAASRARGLLASRGSDFHGEQESAVDIGFCKPLPPGLEPVWSRLM